MTARPKTDVADPHAAIAAAVAKQAETVSNEAKAAVVAHAARDAGPDGEAGDQG